MTGQTKLYVGRIRKTGRVTIPWFTPAIARRVNTIVLDHRPITPEEAAWVRDVVRRWILPGGATVTYRGARVWLAPRWG